MILESYILKGKYFPKESREYLHAVMISLLILLPGLALIYDLYESIYYGFRLMSMVESATLFSLFLLYALFPRYINITTSAKSILLLFTIFLLSTLVIDDYNKEYSIFWLAILPLIPFFFLTKTSCKTLVTIPFVGLVILLVLSYLNIVTLLYEETLIFQILFAYVSFSSMIYVMEKERHIAETKLNNSIESNKILFKEVHHRTKNNMQIMMGLLETQSFKIDDPKYKKMFQAHVDRIKSMSYVHENLYSGNSYDKVDMHKYLGDILKNLQKITQHPIIIDIDYITLDIKDSISLGLIVNEAVNNAMEHAYSTGEGNIDVTLKNNDKQYVLSIKDYGLGFNTQKEYQSLGMTLIEDLSISLTNGRLDITIENGTFIQIYFDEKGD